MDLSMMGCPAPFFDPTDFPTQGGYIEGRSCGNITASTSCCLPCPIEDLIYPDSFARHIRIAYWLNVPAFICQVLLLVTFAVLPREASGRHYLSVGLCLSMIMLELAFIVPLGTESERCYDEITPNDMHTSLSCAWTGALLEAGAMAATVWILLRSLWTNLRVCWDVHHSQTHVYVAHALGWGLPALFLTISLSVTGVSYRLGWSCLPNPRGAIVTWFGWLIGFACAGALIQLGTSAFCLYVYVRNLFLHNSTGTTQTSNSAGSGTEHKSSSIPNIGKKLAWRRVRMAMYAQLRSIVLSILVIVFGAYFGTVYVSLTRVQQENQSQAKSDAAATWATCMVLNSGDKTQCLQHAHALGINQNQIIASLFIAAIIGLCTFCLMVRGSMIRGWWDLIRNPRSIRFSERYGRPSFSSKGGPLKRISAGKPLESEKKPSIFDTATGVQPDREPTGVLPDLDDSMRVTSVPEPGNVSQRHETTNFFEDDGEDGEDEVEAMKKMRRRRKDDDDDDLV